MKSSRLKPAARRPARHGSRSRLPLGSSTWLDPDFAQLTFLAGIDRDTLEEDEHHLDAGRLDWEDFPELLDIVNANDRSEAVKDYVRGAVEWEFLELTNLELQRQPASWGAVPYRCRIRSMQDLYRLCESFLRGCFDGNHPFSSRYLEIFNVRLDTAEGVSFVLEPDLEEGRQVGSAEHLVKAMRPRASLGGMRRPGQAEAWANFLHEEAKFKEAVEIMWRPLEQRGLRRRP